MRRIFVLCLAACSLSSAQVAPSFQLTSEEAAKAKQLTDAIKSAQQRSDAADRAWEDFLNLFQATHPELRPLQFTSDFRIAFGSRTRFGVREAIGFELPAAERQKAESLYREREESRRAFTDAYRNWGQFQWELVAKYVPQVESGKGKIYESQTGMQVTVPEEWTHGIVVIPDFRTAVPR